MVLYWVAIAETKHSHTWEDQSTHINMSRQCFYQNDVLTSGFKCLKHNLCSNPSLDEYCTCQTLPLESRPAKDASPCFRNSELIISDRSCLPTIRSCKISLAPLLSYSTQLSWGYLSSASIKEKHFRHEHAPRLVLLGSRSKNAKAAPETTLLSLFSKEEHGVGLDELHESIPTGYFMT